MGIHSARITAKSIKSQYKRPKAKRILELKAKCAKELFNGKCFICEKPLKKSIVFHHLSYKEGEQTYRDFPNSIQYNSFILQEVYKEPWRFLALCRKDHIALERLNRYNWNKLRRLLLSVKLTNTKENE